MVGDQTFGTTVGTTAPGYRVMFLRFAGPTACGRKGSGPTRRLVGTLEDDDPGPAVAALDHLGDVAQRGEADLDRAEARALLSRVGDVEVHIQVAVRVVRLDAAPQLLVAVGADLDDLPPPPSRRRATPSRPTAHHRGCELVHGHQLPMSMYTVNAFFWLRGTSMVFTRGSSISVKMGGS